MPPHTLSSSQSRPVAGLGSATPLSDSPLEVEPYCFPCLFPKTVAIGHPHFGAWNQVCAQSQIDRVVVRGGSYTGPIDRITSWSTMVVLSVVRRAIASGHLVA